MPGMEQLISDIETYCAHRGISPQKFLREAINAKWSQWQDWKDGKASPTLSTADRLRALMKKGDATVHPLKSGETSPSIQPPPEKSPADDATLQGDAA